MVSYNKVKNSLARLYKVFSKNIILYKSIAISYGANLSLINNTIPPPCACHCIAWCSHIQCCKGSKICHLTVIHSQLATG